jgi:predicted sugar kinase
MALVKSKVYFNRPNNLQELRQRIRAEMEPDIIERNVQSIGKSVSGSLMVGGGNFNICAKFYC